MDHVLPPVFIAIAALCLSFGLYAIWQSLRGLFEARATPARVAARSEREKLVEQKGSLLRALKELRFEHELGKISDQDFEALDARYRAQAKKVLRALDAQLGDFRRQAASLIEAELREAGADGSSNEALRVPASGVEEVADAVAARASACPACGVKNDADAVFCKKCGQRVAPDTTSSGDAPGGKA
ncbi:MAG: zinc ribbon domain-containing protein [Myxococcales bacterium]|nr:zinc ribbon domain-containing protein [Myxococcales bacterium]